ncbi:kinase-like protein [Apiospora saccharicola]|uniref:Kinase-like protein n=1 Tax=Apiospora saccharicola TaxID=335842 RepID=A0ABR1VB29_9PEZI
MSIFKHNKPILPVQSRISVKKVVKGKGGKTTRVLRRRNLYSASANNPVGCEWILMRKVLGRPLFDCWHELEMSRKRRIGKRSLPRTLWRKDLSDERPLTNWAENGRAL